MVEIEPSAKEAIARARVARLATVDDKAQPYLVPVVFVFHEGTIFVPLDEKNKKVRPEELKRVRNIKSNPSVALLIDEYSDDWSRLSYIMILGKASIIGTGKEEKEAGLIRRVQELLRSKYPQYGRVGMGRSCIAVRPERVIVWRNRTPA